MDNSKWIEDVKLLNDYLLLVTFNDEDQLMFDASIGLTKNRKVYINIDDYLYFVNNIKFNYRKIYWDKDTDYYIDFIIDNGINIKPNQVARFSCMDIFLYSKNTILVSYNIEDIHEEARIDINTKKVVGNLNEYCVEAVCDWIDDFRGEIDNMISGKVKVHMLPCDKE